MNETGYVILSARIDELEVSDAMKQQARAMAGELSVELVPDRERVLVGSAHEVEAYCSRVFWPGVGGRVRSSTCEVRINRPGVFPLLPHFPSTVGAALIVTSIKLWAYSAGYETAPYSLRPAGRVSVESGGVYEVRVTVAADAADVPAVVIEATARCYAWQTANRPSGHGLSQAGLIEPVRLQGSIQKSGAAELLQGLRRTHT